jgi:hypothetical protein
MLLAEWAPDADEDILLCHEVKAFLGIRRLKANSASYVFPLTGVRSAPRAQGTFKSYDCGVSAGRVACIDGRRAATSDQAANFGAMLRQAAPYRQSS